MIDYGKFKILSDVPTMIYRKNIFVDWTKMINIPFDIEFMYFGKFNMTLVEIDNDGKDLYFYSKNNPYKKIYKIEKRNFRAGHFSKMLGIINDDFLYEIGDVINSKLITKRIFKKGCRRYDFECINCGYKCKSQIEYSIKGHRCSGCTGRSVVYNRNDLFSNNKEILEYLVDVEDAKRVTKCSGKKIKMKCPICGFEKLLSPSDFSLRGFCCNACSDGKSYPEKFLLNVLNQLCINFKCQYTEKEWRINVNKKTRKVLFDFMFAFEGSKYLIEVDGEQHYKKVEFFNNDYQKLTDREKDLLASNKGFKLIRIDARRSEKEFIKNSILNSAIGDMFDLNIINWDMCDENSNSSLLVKCCDIYNSGIKNTLIISEKLNISKPTAIKYLKKGKDLGLCNYMCPKECYKQNEDSTVELWLSGIKSTKQIGNMLNISHSTVINYLKNRPESGYDAKEELKKAYLSANRDHIFVKVRCITTGEIFNSITEAKNKYNAWNVHGCCNNINKTSGFCNGIPLEWEYYNRK